MPLLIQIRRTVPLSYRIFQRWIIHSSLGGTASDTNDGALDEDYSVCAFPPKLADTAHLKDEISPAKNKSQFELVPTGFVQVTRRASKFVNRVSILIASMLLTKSTNARWSLYCCTVFGVPEKLLRFLVCQLFQIINLSGITVAEWPDPKSWGHPSRVAIRLPVSKPLNTLTDKSESVKVPKDVKPVS